MFSLVVKLLQCFFSTCDSSINVYFHTSSVSCDLDKMPLVVIECTGRHRDCPFTWKKTNKIVVTGLRQR